MPFNPLPLSPFSMVSVPALPGMGCVLKMTRAFFACGHSSRGAPFEGAEDTPGPFYRVFSLNLDSALPPNILICSVRETHPLTRLHAGHRGPFADRAVAMLSRLLCAQIWETRRQDPTPAECVLIAAAQMPEHRALA